ncbi:probable receptor-like protein kinase At2g23200 [Rutidosis leptorrhynchoides]|uniref:probable receptor-like protein kinase At2g23200 n=1 Tax=Rutidosis leptorrhynchoides TaxID=125765 RepID=UPI003A9A0AD0
MSQKSIKIALDDIKSATQNFAETYQIGSVRYGKVYRAELYLFDENIFMETEENNPEEMYRMQSIVAIKHILYDEKDAEKGQDEKDIEKGQDELVFSLEIEMPRRYEHPKIVSLTGFSEEYVKMLRKFEHPNIVAFLGYCKENSEFILVYEFNPNGSLNDYLKSTKKEFYLNWVQRIRICVDIAQGLNYLQRCFMDEERKVYHDIKSANIFLGKNWEAKISDFGLSKYHHVNQLECTASTYTIASSEVYLDPEYLRTGKFEKKSDIYSLGVVFFEILSGRLAYDQIFLNENIKGIAAIAQKCFNEGTLEKIIDPKLFEETEELFFGLKIGVNQESLEVFAKIAFRCLTKSQDRPPTIKVIIKELQDALHIQVSHYFKNLLQIFPNCMRNSNLYYQFGGFSSLNIGLRNLYLTL